MFVARGDTMLTTAAAVSERAFGSLRTSAIPDKSGNNCVHVVDLFLKHERGKPQKHHDCHSRRVCAVLVHATRRTHTKTTIQQLIISFVNSNKPVVFPQNSRSHIKLDSTLGLWDSWRSSLQAARLALVHRFRTEQQCDGRDGISVRNFLLRVCRNSGVRIMHQSSSAVRNSNFGLSEQRGAQ